MRTVLTLLGVVLLASLSGCPLGNGQSDPITFTGDLDATAQGFTMEGEVQYAGFSEYPPFANTTVYLVTANGTVTHAEPLGPLDGSARVSIERDRAPAYVVIDSPDFWEQPDIEVSYFELGENGVYREHVVNSRDQLPVTLSEYDE